MKAEKASIAVAKGDGIGPEIMEASLAILSASGANLEIHPVEIGENVYLSGEPTGIAQETWETIRHTKAFFKAPITTPQGGGFKSLNVTVRSALGLYANVRPCCSYAPFVFTKHPVMDLVIVRENEEDLYTGIEYRQSADTYHALKLISRPGSEKIIRFAFEYAKANGRKKVTCFTKDNILKLSDGTFHKIFDEVSQEYPQIEAEHWIVDIGAAKLAATPEAFDVVVLPNLYGDILSDVAAQISGSVGLAGSANIGDYGAMFEAIHGSAPRRAGQDMANPSGLILASVMMLAYLGQSEAASRVHNGWLKTMEEGIHTYDIYNEKSSREKVGTKAFTQAVIQRLGQTPGTLKPAREGKQVSLTNSLSLRPVEKKELVGVDFYLDSMLPVEQIQPKLMALSNEELSLTMIANRGAVVWPSLHPETFCIDQWRCRFMAPKTGTPISQEAVASLFSKLVQTDLDVTKIEQLFSFDGQPGYTLSPQEQ